MHWKASTAAAPEYAPDVADAWDPDRYHRFREERARPFFDLLDLADSAGARRVLDLGCGSGELTRELQERLGAELVLGIDRSPAMLARAVARPGLAFARGDIARPPVRGRFELVFSNAALQWVDDHPRLLARLRDLVAPAGRLAVQVPANHRHPSHALAAELAGESPFREALDGFVRRSPVLTVANYEQVLGELGFRESRVVLRVYTHELDGPESVVDWVRGTLLTPYEERLPRRLFEAFLARYRERLVARLGPTRPFSYPFERILFRAELPYR